jgi:hypothetical protein
LFDVDHLVSSRDGESGFGLTEDHVTQGESQDELAAGKPMDKPLGATIIKLDRASHDLDTPTKYQTNRSDQ